jgi:hypothetical protein
VRSWSKSRLSRLSQTTPISKIRPKVFLPRERRGTLTLTLTRCPARPRRAIISVVTGTKPEHDLPLLRRERPLPTSTASRDAGASGGGGTVGLIGGCVLQAFGLSSAERPGDGSAAWTVVVAS